MPDHRLFIGTARWDLSAAGRSSSCFIDTSVSSAAILDAIVYYYYKAGIGEQSFFWEEAKGRPKGEEEEKTGCGLDTHCRLRLLTRQCPPVPRPPARTPARPPCCDPPISPNLLVLFSVFQTPRYGKLCERKSPRYQTNNMRARTGPAPFCSTHAPMFPGQPSNRARVALRRTRTWYAFVRARVWVGKYARENEFC